MKTLKQTCAIAVLALLCAAGAAAQVQQPGSAQLEESSGVPWQLAGVWTFNSSSVPTGGFNVLGLKYFQLVFVPSGTVATCAISLDSSTNAGATFSTGGIESAATIGSCASPASYANSSASTPTSTGQLTPTITGSGQVTVALFGYINNPGAAGSSSSTIISPVDGSGYVNIDCKTGCAGGNANGQATMANSAPVVIASNQSAVPVSQATGTNLHAVLDTTSTTAVTQATGTNLHAVLDTTSTTAVTQATAANLNATAAQGATGTNAAAWWAQIGDATHGPAAVKAASTAAAATDPALVVAISPNNTVPVSGTFWQTTQPVSGTFWQATQPVSGTVTTTPPANASTNIAQIAGSTVVADPCQVNARSVALINLTASGQIITGISAKQTYICFLQFALSATADNVALVEGTVTTCGTGTAGMAGGTTAATGWNLLANGSVTAGAMQNWSFKTATLADNVCLLASSAAQISGTVQYVQQ
jgi:hypothetical protein